MALKQHLEESLGRSSISASCHQDVDDVSVLVNRAPKILLRALDSYEHLVHKPGVAKSTSPSLQAPRVFGTELQTPLVNGLM